MSEAHPIDGGPDTITGEQWAATEFEPWVHYEGEPQPPSSREWMAMKEQLTTLHCAWTLMYKTKPELIEFVRTMSQCEPGAIESFIDGLEKVEALFKSWATVLKAAELRLLVATTVLEQEQQGLVQQ